MARVIITAETGCDIPAAEAAELGVELVPMHVTIGDKTIDDGTISPSEMLEQCRQLGVLPRTSGCVPADFQAAFDRIHAAAPDAQILHLAYSAVTTCSLESALTAAEGRDYVTTLDTQHVTVGQGLVVRETAAWLRAHPEADVAAARDFAAGVAARVRMAFLPGDLGYLRAGGRLSNVAFLGATLLKIKPVVELREGRLVATKKLRGSMSGAAVSLIDYLALREEFDPARIVFVKSPGLPDQVRAAATEHAQGLGFAQVEWYETGNVITSHCGPGAIGVALLAKA
ncbi:DegV family protein [Olsenella profusa]|uniref:DegV family EDD domain-containing protein n=1 Tax=Olsenella profusa TaxID=138595 RepID=A0ABS2F2R8_9ACTN|nr:DegV family protein [Olsenella profusa]MBM6775123.1 DegV family EDD domain-containing protein [Olsenella profusa]